MANEFLEAYIAAKNRSKFKNSPDTDVWKEIGKKYRGMGNVVESAKKWVQISGFKKPQPEHCLLLEKVLNTEPGYFSKIFGYIVQYNSEDCKIIRDFYRENIRNSNKSLVYVLIAASEKGRSETGISVKELLDENPEINLKISAVIKVLEELEKDNIVRKAGEEKYIIWKKYD
ncbi:MAG: hypothetical protein K6C99_11415 [Lachnospiraceae bacterium]|nr:hypothetical protein [Lachnospiraceae bacterium]